MKSKLNLNNNFGFSFNFFWYDTEGVNLLYENVRVR